MHFLLQKDKSEKLVAFPFSSLFFPSTAFLCFQQPPPTTTVRTQCAGALELLPLISSFFVCLTKSQTPIIRYRGRNDPAEHFVIASYPHSESSEWLIDMVTPAPSAALMQ